MSIPEQEDNLASADLRRGQSVVVAGSPLDRAQAAMVKVLGRGASAADMLLLAQEFDAPYLARWGWPLPTTQAP